MNGKAVFRGGRQVIALLVFKVGPVAKFFQFLGHGMGKLEQFAREGVSFVVGGIAVDAVTGLDVAVQHVAAALGGAALWAVARGFEWRSGRVGLGDGDIWLLAALGAWTGPAPLPGTVLLGALAGLLYAGLLKALRRWPEDGYIPFGPALMLGAALHAGLGVPAFLRP